jgi:hypothetical protein
MKTKIAPVPKHSIVSEQDIYIIIICIGNTHPLAREHKAFAYKYEK